MIPELKDLMETYGLDVQDYGEYDQRQYPIVVTDDAFAAFIKHLLVMSSQDQSDLIRKLP